MIADQPVFVIKAQDILAIPTLAKYDDLCLEMGLLRQAAEVRKAISEMIDWRETNPELIKAPTHKHVPLDATGGEG